MRYGILGDIHANRSALEAVLDRLERERVDRVVSVGDVVGYGAAPSECIAILQERGALVVKGNHDAACVGELDDRTFNAFARAALRWTREQIPATDRAWLADLPLELDLDDQVQVAHGTLHRPERYDYCQTPIDADPSLDRMRRPLGVVGHTHRPIAFLRLRGAEDTTAWSTDVELDLADAHRCLLNVGSVGQPRDQDPRAMTVVLDTDRRRARLHRVPYAVDAEVARIRDAGLPPLLGERLRHGL